MIKAGNIRALSDFQRNTKTHLRRLKESGEPDILTVNGRAAVIVQDAEAFEAMIDDIVSIRQGLIDAEHGNGVPAREFFEKMARDLKIKLPK